MSTHIRTTREEEIFIESVREELSAGGTMVHKWHVLRLALAFAVRFPNMKGRPFTGSRTIEYDLRQVTGLGRAGSDDITPPLLAMLGANGPADESTGTRGIESEVGRGLGLMRALMPPGDDLWDLLAQAFVPGFAPIVAPLAVSSLAQVVRPFGLRVDASAVHGPRMTVYRLLGDLTHVALPALRAAVLERLNTPDSFVDLVRDRDGANLAIERGPVAWLPIAMQNIPAPTADGLWFGFDTSGNAFSLPRAGGTVFVGRAIGLRATVLRVFAAGVEPVNGIVVVAAHDSPLWDSEGLPAGVERYLPEDPRLISRLSGPATPLLVIDGPDVHEPSLMYTDQAWILRDFAERDTSSWVPAPNTAVRVYVGCDLSSSSLPFAQAGFDLRQARATDALIALVQTTGAYYTRVHLPSPATDP